MTKSNIFKGHGSSTQGWGSGRFSKIANELGPESMRLVPPKALCFVYNNNNVLVNPNICFQKSVDLTGQ